MIFQANEFSSMANLLLYFDSGEEMIKAVASAKV